MITSIVLGLLGATGWFFLERRFSLSFQSWEFLTYVVALITLAVALSYL